MLLRLLPFVLLLSSCAPFTAVEPTSGAVAKGWFTDRGRSGSITMKMPDGEVLKGQYSALRGNEVVSQSFMMGTATGQATASTQFSGTAVTPYGAPLASFSGSGSTTLLTSSIMNAYGLTSTSSGHGFAQGWMKSTKPGSNLFMEAAVRYGLLGGGFGVAQDNQGRTWKIYLGN
jgi:hypothetical protein